MRVPEDRTTMTAAAYVERARGWAMTLEDRARHDGAPTLEDARVTVSRHTGVSPGTLENLRKNRLKAVSAHVYENLRRGVIRALEAELRHLEHELHVLRQTGAHPASDATTAVETDIALVRAALGLSTKG
jgi:hypothetical protein